MATCHWQQCNWFIAVSTQHRDAVNLQLKVLSYLLEKNLDTLKAFSGANKASAKLTVSWLRPPAYFARTLLVPCP